MLTDIAGLEYILSKQMQNSCIVLSECMHRCFLRVPAGKPDRIQNSGTETAPIRGVPKIFNSRYVKHFHLYASYSLQSYYLKKSKTYFFRFVT